MTTNGRMPVVARTGQFFPLPICTRIGIPRALASHSVSHPDTFSVVGQINTASRSSSRDQNAVCFIQLTVKFLSSHRSWKVFVKCLIHAITTLRQNLHLLHKRRRVGDYKRQRDSGRGLWAIFDLGPYVRLYTTYIKVISCHIPPT